jgi:uncharacterized phage infection (PIP) family protein YhgE
MLGYIDWIIILIALMAAVGALLLLYPQSGNRDVRGIRELRSQAEKDRKRIADVLEITQHGAQDAESLVKKLKDQVSDVSRNYQATQARVEQVERMIERVSTAEHEMRDISTQLGERLQHLQGYWDEQLGDSVESVKRIRGKLKEGLESVDESLFRLRDQEKMAQGFTRKLIDHHQQQVQHQQENTRLSAEVHSRLEDMLKESSHLLEQMQRYQQDADEVFQSFNQEISGMESQASEQFTALFQTTDQARSELTAGLEESRQHLGEMRIREAQSDDLSRRIRQQFEQIDHIRVERISKTLDLTDQISNDLHKGVTNAREMLSTLERAVMDVSSSLSVAQPQPEKQKQTEEVVPAEEVTPVAAPVLPQASIITLQDHTDVDLLDMLAPLHGANADADESSASNLVSLRAYR